MTHPSPTANDIQPQLAAIDAAHRAQPVVAIEPVQGPLIAESREMLRLFVQIGNDDLRAALVDLLRTVNAPPEALTSGVPSDPPPTGANRPARNRSS